MEKRRKVARGWLAAALAACAVLPGVAGGQAYPARTITLVVGYPAGGGTDVTGRLVANKLSQGFGSPVVVTNVTGASGNIGAQSVATAPPDGYRLLFVSSAHIMNAVLGSELPFDPVKDFAPVSKIADTLALIVVHPSLGVTSLGGLIDLARKSPGKLNYGSGGIGTNSHMPAELLKSMAGIDIAHVPYKGASQYLAAMLGNEVQVGIALLPATLPHIRAGSLRGLAVTTRKRSSAIPDMPTADEAGVRGYEYSAWFGILAPAGTPAAIVNRLRDQSVIALGQADLLERLRADGSDPIGSTPAEFGAFLRAELVKWAEIVKKAGIKGN
jgi:tripartite-type tricarboxylate transporter receptor subunit TctC